jgi:hypothetical protein
MLAASLGEDLAGRVLAYTPKSLTAAQWLAIRDFVFSLLPILKPVSADAFRKQIRPLVAFLTWTHESGFPLEVATVFTADRLATWREHTKHDSTPRGPYAFRRSGTVPGGGYRLRGPATRQQENRYQRAPHRDPRSPRTVHQLPPVPLPATHHPPNGMSPRKTVWLLPYLHRPRQRSPQLLRAPAVGHHPLGQGVLPP